MNNQTAKKMRSEEEAQLGIETDSITNKQKAFIKLLLRDRSYPLTDYYKALKKLVANETTVTTTLFKGTDKEHRITQKEASQVISDLSAYPFKKRKK